MDDERRRAIEQAVSDRRSMLESFTLVQLGIEYTREFGAPPDPASTKTEIIERMLWKLRLDLQHDGR
jgi:hypothetical protein